MTCIPMLAASSTSAGSFCTDCFRAGLKWFASRTAPAISARCSGQKNDRDRPWPRPHPLGAPRPEWTLPHGGEKKFLTARLTLYSYRTIHRASPPEGASGGVLEVGVGCGVRPAHAERCPGFSAGRILTRKGASPGLGGGLARPGCDAGAARKRLRRRDDTSAAPKRGARDQGVARGARRTRRWAVRPSFLTFARPRRTRGEPIAPRAPPLLKPEGKPGRRAANASGRPAARTTAHALSPPTETCHDRKASSDRRRPRHLTARRRPRHAGGRRGVAELVDAASRLHQAGLSARIPPNRM